MYLAMLAYQGSSNSSKRETLERWDPILTATADYMASYAWKNETSGYYDLGPPYVSQPHVHLAQSQLKSTEHMA